MYIIPQLRGDEKLVYLRKSQTDNPLLTVEELLAKHEQMLTDWVTTYQPDGGPVPPRNIFRELGSGETLAARPQIQKLLRLVESPKIKAIMVTEPSRLTRGDLEDIGYLVKILRYTKTLVITLAYTYDLTDDRDRENFERELMRGNEYLQYTKKIRYNGRLAAAKSGAYITQRAPYGYRKTTIQEGRRTIHTLEPDPEAAPIVKRIFELYTTGLGAMKICDILNREHVPAPRSKLWQHETIPGMLNNVHYLGKIKWDQRKTVRVVEDGEVRVSRPKAQDYLIFEGRHPAIIDQDLWDRVQAIRGSLPKHHAKKGLINPLAGLLRCRCGRVMAWRSYGRGVPRLVCVEKKYCGSASARAQDVIDEIIKVLRLTLEDFQIRSDAGADDAAELHQQMIDRMEKRLEELRKLEVQQWAEKMKNGMPEHVFKQLNDPVVKEIADLESDIHEARELKPEPVNMEEKIVTLQTTLQALADPDAPAKEKNQLLKACIETIEYYRKPYATVGAPKAGDATPIELNITLKI